MKQRLIWGIIGLLTSATYLARFCYAETDPTPSTTMVPAIERTQPAPEPSSLFNEEMAKAFVLNFTSRTIAVLDQSDISLDEKNQALIAIFDDVVDTRWIAKFVLGKYWRTISLEERELFFQLYRHYLIRRYLPSFRTHNNQEKSAKITQVVMNDSTAFITTEITRKEGAPIALAYRIRRKADGSMHVYDIIAEGVSMLTTHRSEFGAVISHHGFDFLLRQMQDQTFASSHTQ